MTTITASSTIGIDLNPATYTSPVVIEAGVTITNPSYPNVVYSHTGSSTLFVIQNGGTISTTSGIGIDLAPGGAVTNAATASITGGTYGVKIAGGAGSVDNNGSIAGLVNTGVGLESGGTVSNAAAASIGGRYTGVEISGGDGTVVNSGTIAVNGGSHYYPTGRDAGVLILGGGIVLNGGSIGGSSNYGVFVGAGGSVTNMTSASITALIHGIGISGAAGTVVNEGTIVGSRGNGVYLGAGGSVTNAASASITGHGGAIIGDVYIRDGVLIGGGAGTVVNDGSIVGSSGSGVALDAGGSVTNAASGYIGNGVLIGGGAGTVINDGSILGNPGVVLTSGGSVTNAASAYIGGDRGVEIIGSAGTVVNSGSIDSRVNFGFGVYLGRSGLVTNAATASITGGASAIIIYRGVGTVINDGSIGGGAKNGVTMDDGGSVTNATSASITGVNLAISGVGTVVNYGSIVGGVSLDDGSITNAASGLIIGASSGAFSDGVVADGTLVNAGTIVGNGGTAVAFDGVHNLLVLDPGFGFTGLVTGYTSGSNTIELASAASAGTIAGLGSKYIHFGAIELDVGAEWSISGIQRGLAGPITGFTIGDTIVLTGVTATDSSYVGGILKLDEAGGGSATLDLPGPFALANFDVTPGVLGGTEVTFVPCFAAGSRILTISGEIAVEELGIGDQVVTLCGGRLAPIVWLGHRYLDCVRHPCPGDVWPIRIKAGAIADGVPHRDLWLSPEHAILLRDEEVLVPIRHLLNGTSIAQVPVPSVTYWHVELASHDAIVAEGLAAETYLDTGNRADFANGGPALTVHPTFADAVWRARACAPQLRHGDALAALQLRLAMRAAGCDAVRLVRSRTINTDRRGR